MKRLLVFPGGASQERSGSMQPLGAHIVIDAERFSEDLPREDYLRLMHKWFQAALPGARFECHRLTLGGE